MTRSVLIPLSIMKDQRLTDTEKLIFGVILSNCMKSYNEIPLKPFLEEYGFSRIDVLDSLEKFRYFKSAVVLRGKIIVELLPESKKLTRAPIIMNSISNMLDDLSKH